MPTRYPIFIIDGASILLHAYKKPVNKTTQHPAVYTFCKTFIEIEQKFNCAHIIIVWDAQNAELMQPNYTIDTSLIIEYIESMDIKLIVEHTFSSSDIIHNITKHFTKKHHEVFIVTVDKTMVAMINDSVKLYDPFKKLLIEKKPESLAALGVNASITIDPIAARSTKCTHKNLMQGVKFLEKLQYKTLITMLEDNPLVYQSLLQLMSKSYKPGFILSLVSTHEQLTKLVHRIKKSSSICINVQGTDIDPVVSLCGGISIAVDDKEVYFIPRQNNQDQDLLMLPDIVASLQEVFADESIEKIMHHAKYNQIILERHGMPVQGKIFDISIAAHLIMQATQAEHSDVLKNFYAKNAMLSYHEMSSHEETSNEPVFIKKELWNSIADTHQSMALKHVLMKELHNAGMLNHFESIEMAAHNAIVAMQIAGIPCDITVLKKINSRITTELKELEIEINSFAPHPIHINAPAQVEKLLFDTLKLPVRKKIHPTETMLMRRQSSTSKEALIELSKLHPVPALIAHYHELYACKHGYLDTLPQFINKITHKVHPYWNQSTVDKEAIISSHPNMQTIPRGDFDHKIFVRSAFIAPNDYAFISGQYKNNLSSVQENLSAPIKTAMIIMHKQLKLHTSKAELVAIVENQFVLITAISDLENVQKIVEESMALAIGSQEAIKIISMSGKTWQDVTPA